MTIQHKMILNEAKDYLFIVLGLLIYTIAFTVFLMPYQIVAGGVTGLSAIIYYATGFHLENTYIIINGILLLVALKILGMKFLMKTIFAIFTLYFMLLFAQELIPKQENGLPFKLMGEGQDFMSMDGPLSLLLCLLQSENQSVPSMRQARRGLISALLMKNIVASPVHLAIWREQQAENGAMMTYTGWRPCLISITSEPSITGRIYLFSSAVFAKLSRQSKRAMMFALI